MSVGKEPYVLELLALIGAVFTTTLWGTVKVFSGNSKKLDRIEKDLNDYKEHVAKNYASHRAMQACSDNINAHIDDSLKTLSAQMLLAINKQSNKQQKKE